MINITFVGKLKSIPSTDKWKTYGEDKYPSGWTRRTLQFNGINGTNRHTMTIQGGYFPDKVGYTIKTLGPSTKDENGKTIAGEKVEILWKDRKDPKQIERVANFKRFVIDIEENGRRQALERLKTNIHEGTPVTDEDLKAVNLTDESQVDTALEESNKKHVEFLSEWDFAEFVHKMLESGKYDDKNFFIRGVLEVQYNVEKKQWYTSLKPQRIYLAKPDEKECCVGSCKLYYTKDAVNDALLEDKDKYVVTAYSFEYDSNTKGNIPYEMAISIPSKIPHVKGTDDGKDEVRAKGVVKKFTVEDDTVKEYGIEFNMLDGAQKKEITEDMLSDTQREDLEMGLISWDDIEADFGNEVYGERISEYVYCGIMKGYTSGPEDVDIEPSKLDINSYFNSETSEDDDAELDSLFS